MLRAELLDGTTVAFAGGANHVADACGRLGARLRVVDAPLPDAEVAELVAFLVSPAGDYFSGCAFTLR